MKSLKQTTILKNPVRWLCCAALGCWFLSLTLPGFAVSSAGDSDTLWPGYMILPVGLLFGWVNMGWAVYANLLFFLILILVQNGKAAGKPIFFMLLLVATLPFLSGIPSGSSPLTAWGWGALIWLTSLFLAIAASGLQQQWFTVRQIGYILTGIAGIYVLVATLHMYQWAQANIQEREIYLSNGLAFTVVPLCGIPLSWPEDSLIGADEILELDIDPSLDNIRLPEFERWRSGEFEWVMYNFTHEGRAKVMIRYQAPLYPPRFSLQAKATEQGALIRLVQKDTGGILHEQKLRKRRLFHDRYYHEYCPAGWPKNRKGYEQALLRALGRQTDKLSNGLSSQTQLQAETALESCDLGEQDIGDIKGLRMWDGREVVLPPSFHMHRGFCSKTYIAAATVGNHPELLDRVYIFDRGTLQPLAEFKIDDTCSKSCTDITGIQISDDNVTVKTTLNDTQAKRKR